MMGSLGHTKGSETAIEGDAGFLAAYAGSTNGELSYVFTGERRIDLSSITEGLGSHYKLLTVMFRMYNTSGYNQPVIDLMTELTAEHHLDPSAVAQVVIYMNYLETLYPSPEFPRFSDPGLPRVGSTQFFCAHALVNGGYPVVGGSTFGPTGEELEQDQAVIDFMTEKVRLVGVHDQAMFSPEISVHLNSGVTLSKAYPYARMEWMFDELVTNLKRCLPGFPGGEARFEALVGLVGTLEALPSVEGIVEEMGRS
jgi:hypothetical protein